jgi:hypothetical protein
MISKEKAQFISKLEEQQQIAKAEGRRQRQDQARRGTETENISF